MNIPRAGMPLTDMYTHTGGKAPHIIVENILVNCIKLNGPFGTYGHQPKQATIITKVEEIQSFVDDIVIIKKGAELLDLKDLLTPKGPLNEFTMAEKKRLFEMRNAGVHKTLLYRIKEFDRFCKSYLLESRASLGVSTGRLWLSQPLIADRLSVPKIAWNTAIDLWFSSVEETVFQLSGLHELLAISLVIRYSLERSVVYDIPGPEENLWLDYPTVTGWELIDGRSEAKAHLMWRVSVVAIRAIQPFEEIVRASPQKEQYLLHQSPDCTK
ncbi:unnamed protein product [Penicillium nalgiovense]|nr:unnamed protein product [Penicillium nalgiovense]